MNQTRLARLILVSVACLLTFVICRRAYTDYMHKSLLNDLDTGNIIAASTLLDRGAAENDSGLLPRYAMRGSNEAVSVLIEHRESVGFTESIVCKSFALASGAGHFGVVRLMLENKATSKIVSQDKKELTDVIDRAAHNYQDLKNARDVLNILHARGEHVSINQAAMAGDTALLQVLLCDPGANVDEKYKIISNSSYREEAYRVGRTPLFEAIERKSTATVKLLLEYGANPNFKTKSRLTPLDLALFERVPEIVALLKKAGAQKAGAQTGTPTFILVCPDKRILRLNSLLQITQYIK